MSEKPRQEEFPRVLSIICKFLEPYLLNYCCCAVYESEIDVNLLRWEFIRHDTIPDAHKYVIFYTYFTLIDIIERKDKSYDEIAKYSAMVGLNKITAKCKS